jgi:serine/threonine protein kinase
MLRAAREPALVTLCVRARGVVLGQRLQNFSIMRLLGEGGMSSVYEAEHALIRRKVAVKVLKSELSVDGAQVQRFFNEARATSAIRHPNIVEVIDVGRLADGVPYLVMELLEGESLGERLERLISLEIPVALDYAHQAASALVAAHALRIVHRDLKPDNIFIVPDQRLADRELIKVLDFGIAKLRGELAAPPFDTMVGAVLGTPPYMSPEQCRGLPEEIDERTDVYALGIILYEMLCGQPPFVADGAGELMMMHMTEQPEPPSTLRPEISPALEHVILRALAKRREDRFASMSEFDAALTEISIALGVIEPAYGRRSVPAAIGGRLGADASLRAAASYESDTTLSAAAVELPAGDRERERAVTRALSRRSSAEDPSSSGVVALGLHNHSPTPPGFVSKALAHGSETHAIADAEFDEEPPTSQRIEVEVDLESDGAAPAEVPFTLPPAAAECPGPRPWLSTGLGAVCLVAALGFGILTVSRSAREPETSTAAASHGPSTISDAQGETMSEPAPLVSATAHLDAPPTPPTTAGLTAMPIATDDDSARESPPASDANPVPPVGRAPGHAQERVRAQAPGVKQPLLAAVRRAPPAMAPAPGIVAKPAQERTEQDAAETQPRERVETPKLRRGAAPARTAALSMSDFEAEISPPQAAAAPHPAATSGEQPQTGYLSLDSAPWSDVFLGTDRLGTTPLIRVPLPPGKYLLTLRNPELGASTSYAVEIQAGKTVSRLVGWEHR